MFRKKFINISALVMLAVFLITMPAMIVYAKNKTVIVEEQDVTWVEVIEIPAKAKWKLDVNAENSEEEGIVIKCPSFVTEKNTSVSVRYDEKTISVTLKGMEPEFFLNNQAVCNSSMVTGATGEYNEERVLFTFSLKEMCECIYSFNGNDIELTPVPYEKKDRCIVVVDAGHGGSSLGTRVGNLFEKDVTLAISAKIKELSSDRPYEVFLTRDGDYTVSSQQRLEIVRALEADCYVGIMLGSNMEDTKLFGMYADYNDVYFRRELKNAEFADAVLRNCASYANNKALGIFPSGEEDVLLEVLDIPGTMLYAGYLTNAKEAELLSKDEYIETVAKGVIAALDEMIGNK